ncbi:MAG: GIY-YIG nuclease family protein, partial [Alistipes sp.]
SVPFAFDIHALIFSEDAPALEATLHKAFETKRVNMINLRREFFNVSLSEIEDEVVKNHGSIEFTKIAEAEQYRETLALRESLLRVHEIHNNDFPSELLSN